MAHAGSSASIPLSASLSSVNAGSSSSKKQQQHDSNGKKGNSSAASAAAKQQAQQQAAADSANDDDKKKQRSSKACDACRRQKCKCQRTLNEHGQEEGPCQNCKQNSLECTFFVTSKKRGPPKGYIEAIENRMHRMEALLGGLLNNDDPRAQALLEELVGDIEARELLSKDLAEAAAIGRDNAPLLKSWQRSTGSQSLKREDSIGPLASMFGPSSTDTIGGTPSTSRAPITQRGFELSDNSNNHAFSTSLSNAGVNMDGTAFNGDNMHKAAWIPDDELLGGSDTSPSFSAVGLNNEGSMDFESIHPASAMARSIDNNASNQISGSLPGASSFASSALAIPASNPFAIQHQSQSYTNQQNTMIDPSNPGFASFGTSPRQRRKLDPKIQGGARSGSAGGMSQVGSVGGGSRKSPALDRKNSNRDGQQTHNLFSLAQRSGGVVPAPDSILHTGAAYYNLTANAGNMSPGGSTMAGFGDDGLPSDTLNDGMSPGGASNTFSTTSGGANATQLAQQDGPLSELADVVGQLSLDETKEVRYHGRSSGLYLISKSNRYQDFFWRFPKPGAWAQANRNDNSEDSHNPNAIMDSTLRPSSVENAAEERIADPYSKTEAELVNKTKAYEIMPDKRTSDHLLELYWTYVHPHLPLLYRSLFVRQYRNTVHTSEGYSTGAKEGDGSSSTTPLGGAKPAPALASGGKVPAILLLSIYALAARYSDTGEDTRKEGEYWKAGEIYARKARELLYEDFGSSRLTTCQALVLLAYREAGVGAMAKSWTYVGMAIRMAQDLGLFRDVDKWFLPVNAFGYEEKQTRKRVWWSCVILDRYISAYIGRPMGIFERDYDVALPAEDEPDEHDIWRPLRPDGTDWSDPPIMNTDGDQVLASIRNYPQGVKSNSLSCFNHSASLSVLFSRIIANLYAIRVRVLGQNSETLLAHLDQALATWWLKLPAHLQYNSASKRVPPPHVLTLHCQFYAALILLHRPFIPAQGSPRTNQTFPSHSICTTAAAAISNIVTLYSKTYGLRQAIPFMVYYIFSAGIMHFYNSTYDESLALTAKAHLVRCMNALKEMQVTWGAAARQRELLVGFVDAQDLEIYGNLDISGMSDNRGRKREAENQDVESLPGSGRATPYGNRATPMDIMAHFSNNPPRGPFATASLGQMSAGANMPAQPRRTASQTNQKNQAASKRRHNSISAAGLRQSANQAAMQHAPADMRINTSVNNNNSNIQPSTTPASSAAPLFPQGDFTFVSPPAPSIPLPLPSPSWGKVNGFEFGHAAPLPTGTSPSSAFFNFASPPMIPPASEFASHDNPHISNILGLTTPNDIINTQVNNNNNVQTSLEQTMDFGNNQSLSGNNTQNQDNTNMFNADNTALDANQADSGEAPKFGDIAEFLFDPFWQSQMRQMVANSNDGSMMPNSGAFSGLPDLASGPMFGDTQASDLFGGMPAQYSQDDWNQYFSQHTPNQS